MVVDGIMATIVEFQVTAVRSDRNVQRHYWQGKTFKALALASAGTAFMFLLAAIVAHLPLSGSLKDQLTLVILSPIRPITWAMTHLVNFFGPSGRPEPLSQCLPAWMTHALVMLSVVLFVLILFGLAFAVLSWIDRKQSGRAGDAAVQGR